jgi:hypothetical protein
MNDDERSKIADKIRKLLALGSSPNENEAAAAVAKAQQLMFSYNIALEDLVVKTASEIGERRTDINLLVTWQNRVIVTVASTSLCRVYIVVTSRMIGGHYTAKKDKRVVLVGRDHDTELAELIISWLFGELNRLSNSYANSLKGALSPAERKVARRSWLEGAAAVVSRRLLDEFDKRRQSTESSTALVIHRDAELSEYMEKKTLEQGKSSQSTRKQDWAAYMQGAQDGEKVALRPGEKGLLAERR